MVRHLPPSDCWHSPSDHLAGKESFGNSSLDGVPWSVPFGEFDEFLFASGNFEKWLVTTKEAVLGSFYANEEREILKSSKSPTPYKARWYNRDGVDEDPWISLTDHHDAISSNDLIYGGNSFDWASHTNHIRLFGGMNVFVRALASTCNAGYYGDGITCSPCRTCDSHATSSGCPAGTAAINTCTCNAGYYAATGEA